MRSFRRVITIQGNVGLLGVLRIFHSSGKSLKFETLKVLLVKGVCSNVCQFEHFSVKNDESSSQNDRNLDTKPNHTCSVYM